MDSVSKLKLLFQPFSVLLYFTSNANHRDYSRSFLVTLILVAQKFFFHRLITKVIVRSCRKLKSQKKRVLLHITHHKDI
ncbi:unnamed protein product [Rhizophagus irregularis]|uniref:Uncharacterized protein n=1 Tax=Rhizophagus irregularis TaxID=588596 RepID=A0A916E6P3_9GLOM|nr:unnamed protein product [Rhizophagus irregularis]CAB5366550.1 unnamed protein product [Rhizophagus irregularis]